MKQIERINTMSDLFAKQKSIETGIKQLEDLGLSSGPRVDTYKKGLTETLAEIEKTSKDFGLPENRITREDALLLTKAVRDYVDKGYEKSQRNPFLKAVGQVGSGYGKLYGTELEEKPEEEVKAELQEYYANQLISNRANYPILEAYRKQVAGPGKPTLSLQETFQYDPNAILGYSEGGVVERKGFKDGPKITRRGFLGAAAALIASLKIGSFGKTGKRITTEAGKKVLKNAPDGTPDWFAPLVDKVMKEGVDAGETMKTTTSREIVKKLEVKAPESDGALTDKYYLYENPDTGEIRIEIDAPGLGTYDGEFSLYMRPSRVDGINDDGTPIIDEGEFFVTEDRVVGRASSPDDYDIDLEPLDTDLEGSASNWHKVEEFATGKTNKKAQAKQLEKKERIEAFPHEDLTDRYGDYDPPDPDDY